MVLYTCELCNYKSEYLTRYNEHCMTKKHLRNIEKVEKKQVMVSDNKCQHNVNTKIQLKLTSVDYVGCHLLQGKVGADMKKNTVKY